MASSSPLVSGTQPNPGATFSFFLFYKGNPLLPALHYATESKHFPLSEQLVKVTDPLFPIVHAILFQNLPSAQRHSLHACHAAHVQSVVY